MGYALFFFIFRIFLRRAVVSVWIVFGFVWKWLVPLHPMVLLIIIPTKWLFHWGYTPFSDIPIWSSWMLQPSHSRSFDARPRKINVLRHVAFGERRKIQSGSTPEAPEVQSGSPVAWEFIGKKRGKTGMLGLDRLKDVKGQVGCC